MGIALLGLTPSSAFPPASLACKHSAMPAIISPFLTPTALFAVSAIPRRVLIGGFSLHLRNVERGQASTIPYESGRLRCSEFPSLVQGEAYFAPNFVLTGCSAIVFVDRTLLDVPRGTPPGGGLSPSRYASKSALPQGRGRMDTLIPTCQKHYRLTHWIVVCFTI